MITLELCFGFFDGVYRQTAPTAALGCRNRAFVSRVADGGMAARLAIPERELDGVPS
ncbi:MAG: hypothetical protein HYR63_02355 [Proteobacteria bacterium]|nr:hypothetical protein [Pseudomonadota bacterium]MBI3498395.1 hypothetical protein [Pseudomonadota bacterium]